MQNFNLNITKEKGSILQLMVENPEGVKATIDLLKGEVAVKTKQLAPRIPTEHTAKQLSSLSNLLSDTRVRQMVNNVAGENVVSIMDRTLSTIDSTSSTEVKQQALTKGITKIHENLKNSTTLRENQSFNLAASLIGLDERKYKLLEASSFDKMSY